jgi:hypothetical protein
MKRLLSIFLAGVALAMNLRADDLPSSFLRTYSLDERVGYSIPVALHRGMTTLVFPEPPRNFAASRIAFIEPGQTVPDFSKDDRVDFVLLAHRGSTTCSIEALRPDSQDTLSVFLGDKVYQLFLRADEDQPLLTVEFKYRPDVGNNQVAAVSPNRLIDCLTRAKAYPLLRQYYPGDLDGVTHVVSNHLIDYPDFRVQISDIFRFDQADTLVFHVLLENRTSHPIAYQRRNLCVRVESQNPSEPEAGEIYNASIVDASGQMPAESVTSAWFAITGTRTGGRNELDPARNIFTVLVPSTNNAPVSSASMGKRTADPKSTRI